MTIIPVNPLPVEGRLYTNITPFTVHNNATYLIILESMRQYINDKLVPFINTNIANLDAAWVEQTQELIESWNVQSAALIEYVDTVAAGIGTSVEDAIAAQAAAEAARDLAEQYASQAEAIQDVAVSGIVNNPNSTLRETLETLFASEADIVAVSASLTALSEDIGLQIAALDQQYVKPRSQAAPGPVAPLPWINVVDYGAVTTAGVDNTSAITAAFAAGLNVIIPEGVFEISAHLPIRSGQTVRFDGWLKVVNPEANFEAPITLSTMFNGFPAVGVTIINPLIDLNNAPGANGIIIRDQSSDVQVIGGRIRNAVHQKGGYLGGRAINIEAGTGDSSTPSNVNIMGVNIDNCYAAVSVQGSASYPEKNVRISNLVVNNCESLIQLHGNAAGFPHSGNVSGCFITGITAYNVGKSLTYNRAHGIINSNRGSNAHISGVKVYNTPTYSESGYGVGAVIHGEISNVILEDVEIESTLSNIVNISSWSETDAPGQFKFGSRGNRIKIVHRGTATNTINYSFSYNPALSGGEGDANPFNNIFDIDTWAISSDRVIPNTVMTYPDMYIKLYSASNKAKMDGFVIDFGSQLISTFAGQTTIGGKTEVIDSLNDKTGGLKLRSFAPVVTYNDLSGGARKFRTAVDGSRYTLESSVDGVTWEENYAWQAGRMDVNSSFMHLSELSADAGPPPADGVRIYARDNGIGKTQIVARFNTGAVVVLGTQP